MNSEKIRNVKITDTRLTMREHGVLTFHVFFEGQCCGGFGGYAIGHGYLGASQFDATGSGLVAMMKIMDVVGVSDWEKLPGQYVRIVDPGLGGVVTKIGNIISDKWFDIDAFFKYEQSKKELKKDEIDAG